MTPTNALKFAIALIYLGITSALAQIPSTETSGCNPKTAQMLVEQQVAESKSVVERPKRVKILLRSADFLWLLDQPTARGYFVEAFKTASEHFTAKGFERVNLSSSSNKGSTVYTQLPDQRTEVIRAVAIRDPELAKKFTEQLLADYDKALADRDQNDKTREPGELLMFAAENAKSNPELSRYMFGRVMRYPLIQNWFWALYSAARNDQAFADSIYLETLRNYRNEKPHRLLYLSAYPFGNASSFGQGSSRYSANVPDGFVPNTDLQRAFLAAFFTRIGTFAANAEESTQPSEKNESSEAVYMVTAIRELEPVIMERLPNMLEQFSVARSQANSLLTADMQKEIATRD